MNSDEWNPGCYNDGAEARIVYDAGLDQAPSRKLVGDLARASWIAGWIDADKELNTNPVHGPKA